MSAMDAQMLPLGLVWIGRTDIRESTFSNICGAAWFVCSDTISSNEVVVSAMPSGSRMGARMKSSQGLPGDALRHHACHQIHKVLEFGRRCGIPGSDRGDATLPACRIVEMPGRVNPIVARQ